MPTFTLVPKLQLFSFPRAAWECGQGALRRKSRCLYGTQRVQYCIPTRRVGTRGNDAASRRHSCIKARSGVTLVPKLQLGNPVNEALGNCSLRCSRLLFPTQFYLPHPRGRTSCIHAVAASRDGKLELPALNSQAGETVKVFVWEGL